MSENPAMFDTQLGKTRISSTNWNDEMDEVVYHYLVACF